MVCIYPIPLLQAGGDTMSVFKQSATNFYLEFSFSKIGCQSKTKELSLPYCLPITGEGRKTEYMPFLKVLEWSEMQKASSKIWNWGIHSVFLRYAKHTSIRLWWCCSHVFYGYMLSNSCMSSEYLTRCIDVCYVVSNRIMNSVDIMRIVGSIYW